MRTILLAGVAALGLAVAVPAFADIGNAPDMVALTSTHSVTNLAAGEGVREGAQQLAAGEGVREGAQQLAAGEGVREGAQQLAAGEGVREGAQQLAA